MAKPGDIERAIARVTETVGLRLGIGKSPTDFVRRMKWGTDRPNSTRKISNWFKGLNGPAFDDTMDMLGEAGLLQPEAEAAWRGISLLDAAKVVDAARKAAAAAVQEGHRGDAAEPPRASPRRAAAG